MRSKNCGSYYYNFTKLLSDFRIQECANNPMSKPEMQNSMRYVGLASQWMVMLAVAAWLGYKLDHYLGWKAACVIIFPLAALIASLWKIVKDVSKPGK